MTRFTLDESALLFAQRLGGKQKPTYSIKDDAIPSAGSGMTAYRRLNVLKTLGIVKSSRGHFTLNTSVVLQPRHIVEKLLPSLEALKKGKRFGRYYNNSDIRFALNNIHDKIVTLDYKAWQLTEYQSPSDLYVYVKNFEQTVSFLKNAGFSEGNKGQVVVLPMIGDFTNEIERVYLDCIAKGGRSLQDAVAIELVHGNSIQSKAFFTIDLVKKVQDDLPAKEKLT